MKAKKSSFFDHIVRFLGFIVLPYSQIAVLVFTSLLTGYFAYRQIEVFTPLESPPLLYDITPKKLRVWNAEPVEVKVGMQVINFSDFNLVDNEFLVDVIVWFEFDPSLVSLDSIGDFYFDKGEVKKKSAAKTKIVDGKFFAEYEVRFGFSSNVTHQLFPLDDHRIYMTLINNSVSPSELVFDASPSGFTISDSIFIRGWNVVSTGVNSGYEEWELDKHDKRRIVRHSKVVFSMDFKRSGTRFIFLILLPIFLIFFIGLFSFAFNPADSNERGNIMNLASASLASLLAYRFVINNMAPSGVGYFMLSDHIFNLFLTLSFVELCVAITLVRYQKLTTFVIVARGILFLLFHIISLAVWYYLLFLWIK
jgi:hypothetical protein